MTEGKCEAQTVWDVEERRLVVAPWQCACTHLVRCEEIIDKKITWPLFPTLPSHLTLPPCDFYVFPKMKLRLKGPINWRDPSRIATGTKHANAGRRQRVLPKMAKSLGSLYTSSRWLLRRWRWKLGLKVSVHVIHVITCKFLEMLGSTAYVCGA